MSRKDFPMLKPRVLRGVLRMIAMTLPAWSMSAVLAQSQVTRTVAYEYHPVTGQVIKETVEPGSNDCVLTEHVLDAYGNRKLTTTSSCSPSGANFVPRATHYVYAAQNGHAEGAFVTALRVGKPGLDTNPALAMSRASNRVDPATGQPLDKTIEADAGRHLTTRVEYDGFGRLKRQYAPVDRDGAGNQIDGYAETRRVYCLGPLRTAQPSELAACLDIRSLSAVTVDYQSRLNTNADGDPVSAVQPMIVSAYYVETQTYGPSGEAMGAPAREHYDSLHRLVAKELRHFSGRWVMELTAYDELGLAVAGWSNFYGRDASGAVTMLDAHEHRQWTAAFDLMHRPVDQRNYWRGTLNGTLMQRRQLTYFRGQESATVVPADSSPDGQQERRTVVQKDGQGLALQTVDAYGATLNMAYDPVGNMVRTVDAMGNETRIAYSPGHARFKVEMTDPSVGTWKYEYDGAGQLRKQTDAKLQVTRLEYDELGRMTAKRNADLNTLWYHDRNAAGQACASGHNRVCEVASGGDPANAAVPKVSQFRMSYDALARPTQTTLSTGDRTFTTGVGYDHLGRVATQTYPTGFALRYGFSAATDAAPGTVVRVADAANSARVFWQIDSIARDQVFNERGQLLKAKLGNGLFVSHQIDSLSGKAFQLRTGSNDGWGDTLDHRYDYDVAGNIVSRLEARMGVLDQFQYDRLNRLTNHQLNSASDAAATRSVAVTYNALGSILSKEDVGGYRYEAAGSPQPFAVKSAGGSTYAYDGNGQLTTVTGVQRRTNTWTAFNRPSSMSYGSNKVTFLYDGDYKRLREEFYSADVLQRRVFQLHPDGGGGLSYEREDVVAGANPRVEHRHYVSIGGDVVAVVKTLGEGAGAVQADPRLVNYWHEDALGSIVAVSDANGQVFERTLFDPWGRRQASTGAEVGLTESPAHGDRGFTGHEHLDELGLIHMNARLYDPLLGRFISADPLIQDPMLLQGYNRYSYVLNNPLIYRDPTGEWWQIPVFIAGFVLAQEGNQYWRMVGQIMMMAALSGAGGQGGLVQSGMGAAQGTTFAAGGLGNAMVSAGVATALTPGATFESVAQSMLFAAAFNTVGAPGAIESVPGRMVAHALVGCVQGAVSGGQCGPSALSAFVSKGISEGTSGLGLDRATQGVLVMMAGGTASVVGGGKFVNGAGQAGVAYLFNALSSYESGEEGQRLLRKAQADLGREVIGEKLLYRAVDANRVPVEIDGKILKSEIDALTVDKNKLVNAQDAKHGTYGKFSANELKAMPYLARGDIQFYGSAAAARGLDGVHLKDLMSTRGWKFGGFELWNFNGANKAVRQMMRTRTRAHGGGTQ
jgi:RHS repeat-associated protein